MISNMRVSSLPSGVADVWNSFPVTIFKKSLDQFTVVNIPLDLTLHIFNPKPDCAGRTAQISPNLFDERYIKLAHNTVKLMRYFENSKGNPDIMKHSRVFLQLFQVIMEMVIQVGSEILTKKGINYNILVDLRITEKFFEDVVQVKFTDTPLNRSLLRRAIYSSLHKGLFPFTELELIISKEPLSCINVLTREIEYGNPSVALICIKSHYNAIVRALSLIYPNEIFQSDECTFCRRTKLNKIRTKFPDIISEQQ
jgi:hypothetical protein